MGVTDKLGGTRVFNRIAGIYGQFAGIHLSFESGVQDAYVIPVFERMKIISMHGIVMTNAIAGTDNATVTLSNETGAMAGGVLTFTASDAVGTEKTAGPPTTNHILEAGEKLTLTPAKTTAGGDCMVSVKYQLLA